MDLQILINAGLLQVHAMRPMASGPGMHLASMHKLVDEYEPEVVVIDPISNLTNTGDVLDVRSILTQLIDYLKTKRATTVCTSHLGHDNLESQNAQGVSSLMDTWINLRFFESDNERNRGISIVKSRDMSHSNQVCQFLLTDYGVELVEVYLSPTGGLLMGSSRAT